MNAQPLLTRLYSLAILVFSDSEPHLLYKFYRNKATNERPAYHNDEIMQKW